MGPLTYRSNKSYLGLSMFALYGFIIRSHSSDLSIKYRCRNPIIPITPVELIQPYTHQPKEFHMSAFPMLISHLNLPITSETQTQSINLTALSTAWLTARLTLPLLAVMMIPIVAQTTMNVNTTANKSSLCSFLFAALLVPLYATQQLWPLRLRSAASMSGEASVKETQQLLRSCSSFCSGFLSAASFSSYDAGVSLCIRANLYFFSWNMNELSETNQ